MEGKSVLYFKKLLEDERTTLLENCSKWQDTLADATIPEDACGEIRTSIGLTELLLNKKMKQFAGLVSDCESNAGLKKVTLDDLQGFWDMVYFEVEKVKNKFDYLHKLQESEWVAKEAVPVKKTKLEKAKLEKQPTAVPFNRKSFGKAHALAARKRIAEARAKLKQNNVGVESSKENFICLDRIPTPIISEGKKKDETVKQKHEHKNSISAQPKSKPTTRKPKEFIPLACVTRAAKKRALLEQNKI